jgi:hypothetical protein
MTAPGSFDSLTAPTIESAKITFAAVKHTVDSVTDDCRAVCETLSSLGEALSVLTDGESLDGGLSGASLVGLPMMAAVRAAKAIASRYVTQQTGTPLDTWVDLVRDASAQFEAYLTQLDTVDQIAQRYRSADQDALDPTQTREDLEILQQTQWQTRAWKQILGRVARLGQLVDAILNADLHDDAAPAEAAPRASGFSASLQRRIQDVQTRTSDKTSDLREWVLQPFVEIRDKVMELPAQTGRLSGQIETLEILLDLEVATIRACAGEISPAAARVIGIRVAANVVLPDLVLRLRATRNDTLRFENYLARLEAARHGGNIHERVHAVLNDEYRKGLHHSRSELEALEARAQTWRSTGPAVLAACSDWLAVELDVLAARALIEQQEPPGDRRRLLQREQHRLNEARTFLASL